jgi:cell wall-associated NlpC family hydrolase
MKKFKNVRKIILGLTVVLSAATAVMPTSAFAASTTTSVTANQIIATGKKYMGVHYKHGGHTKAGFDCQGLMKFIFGQYGIHLPSGARKQSTVGTYVSRDQLKPGDLVFFSTVATMKYSASSIKRIGHVGVYIGNGQVLHTYGKPGVTITNLNSKWWSKHYVTARRVL